MKKSSVLIVLAALTLLCVFIAISGCNKTVVTPNDKPATKYPMNQLPSDVLEPDNYSGVTDNFVDGYKVFIFKFNDINAAGEQKIRLSENLIEKNYECSYDGAVSIYEKDGVIVKLRQSVDEKGSELYVSIPYEFRVKNLPIEISYLPLFDGKLYNSPVVTSADEYDAFTNVTLTFSYFDFDSESTYAFCRYLELEGYAFGKTDGDLNVKIATYSVDGRFEVSYVIDGFSSEREWDDFVATLKSINFERGGMQPLSLDVDSYAWINEWLSKVGYEGALTKISSGKITYGYSENSVLKITDKCTVKVEGIPLGTAISYVTNLRNNLSWQDSLYVDNEEKTAWTSVDKSSSFEWYGKCGLLSGKFRYEAVSETSGNFFIDLICLAPMLSEKAKELATSYTIRFKANDAPEFTAQGKDFSYSIVQNGVIIYRSSAPIFADLNDEGRYQLFAAHIYIAKEYNLAKKETANYLGRECTVYETVIDGKTWRYYVDDELDLTLKKESEESGTTTTVFEVTELSFES